MSGGYRIPRGVGCSFAAGVGHVSSFKEKIDVVLLGQNNLVREGLRRIIQSDQFNVAVSEESRSFLLNRDSHGQTAELFVIDAGNSDSLDTSDVEQIHHDFPTAKIVFLHDAFDFNFMVDAFQSGADGYIIKNISCEPLIESLRLVVLGEKIMPSALAQHLPEWGRKPSNPVPNPPKPQIRDILSDREIETLRFVCRGDPNKIIARRLDISEATVKVHVKAILRKLHLRNRTQAVAWTLNSGLDLSLPDEAAQPVSEMHLYDAAETMAETTAA